MKSLFPLLLMAIVFLAVAATSGWTQVELKKKLPTDATTKQKNSAAGSIPPASTTDAVQLKKNASMIQGTTPAKTKSKPGVQSRTTNDQIIDKKALPAETKTLPPDLTRDPKSLPAQTKPLPSDSVGGKQSTGSLIKGKNQGKSGTDSGAPVTLIKGLWIESFKFDRPTGTLKAVFGNKGFATINDGKYTIYKKTATKGLEVISSGNLRPIGPNGSTPVNVKQSLGEETVVFKVDVVGGDRSLSQDFTVQTTFVLTYQLRNWTLMGHDFREDTPDQLKGFGEKYPNKLRSYGFEVNVKYIFHRSDFGDFLNDIFGKGASFTETIIKMRAVDPIVKTFNNRKQAEAFRDEVKSETGGVVTPVLTVR